MTGRSDFNADYWVAVATVAPVLLVAFAATSVDVLSLNRTTKKRDKWGTLRKRIDYGWVVCWVYGTPPIGGATTLFAISVLWQRHDTTSDRALALIGLAALLLGLLSTGVTINSFRRGQPDRVEELLRALGSTASGPPPGGPEAATPVR